MIGLALALCFAALAAFFLIGAGSATPAPRRAVGATPLDEAERILAERYARGRIGPEEYQRMLAVLRR